MIKIESKNSLYPHRYFIEHLVDVFKKSPWKNNLNQESSSLLIKWLKNNTGISLQWFIHSSTTDNKITGSYSWRPKRTTENGRQRLLTGGKHELTGRRHRKRWRAKISTEEMHPKRRPDLMWWPCLVLGCATERDSRKMEQATASGNTNEDRTLSENLGRA
jgi:hypothetical protein